MSRLVVHSLSSADSIYILSIAYKTTAMDKITHIVYSLYESHYLFLSFAFIHGKGVQDRRLICPKEN